jgi:SAM-dependent methyltransferase
MSDTGPVDAATRWQRMVTARLAEMEKLAPGRGSVGGSYWNQKGRARRYSTTLDHTGETDPVFPRLAAAAGPGSTVVDVGAGTGRFSLALAPRVAQVVSVDASSAMLCVLKRTARARGITNVRSIESRWEDAPLGRDGVPMADVVFSSFVVPLIPRAAAFLQKMDSTCRGTCFVTMNGSSSDTVTEPLWRHFHGKPRRPAPTYLDLQGILREQGSKPKVEMVEVPMQVHFPTLAAAVKSYRDVLVLPETDEVKAELRSLLSSWLVQGERGLRPPVSTMPAAIVSWKAGRMGKARR